MFTSSLFLSCCVTISPTNAFSFPLSSDCESTDVFLTIQSFSSSLRTLKRFSRRKRALTFRTSLRCAWVLLLAVLSVCGLLPNCVHLPITILHAAVENLLSVVGLSHRAADVTVASTVMGGWSKIKHKTDHVDANLHMNLKESH